MNNINRPIKFKIIFMVAFLSALLCCGCGSSSSGKNENIVRATVHSVSEDMGSEYEKPAEGYVYLVLDLEVENVSDGPISTKTEIMQQGKRYVWFKLKHPDGYEYKVSTYNVKPSFPRSDIEPGEKSRGNLAFEVPQDWERLTLQVMWEALLKPEEKALEIEISREKVTRAS